MTLTELRYIVALAEEQHFGRAAERCHVSQPTLSIAIKRLEDELAVVLFERGKQGVLVTPLGKQIVLMAGKMLDQAAQIKDVANSDKEQLQGPLALGTLPTIGPYLLPQFIPLLQEMAPGLTLYVEEDHQASLAAKLREGELDAILITAPFNEPDIVVQPLFDEPFVLLLPAHHPLVHKDSITATDLNAGEVLLLREGHSFRDQVTEAFPHLRAVAGDQATPRFIQGSTLETLRHMVASGLGITILPQTATETSQYSSKQLTTRPFAAPVPKRTLCLAWRVSFPRHKSIDMLRKAIQASSAAYWNYSTEPDPQDSPGILVENRDW
ncbi:MAG TPA: LysR substrate-binding domain-containing protein [Steroidobacteraceae bacterium]|jgi:LysR family hydrogen peroxide-inducible transcriptional activator|nr:LysR substrate-binding domain-containing protein [Steroidobacteraceae bacterium]